MSRWPEADPARDDDALLHAIGVVQKVVDLARAARGQSGVRTRQPLSKLLIHAPDDRAERAIEEHKDQVLEELNVKSLEFIARDAGFVDYRIKPNLPKLGRQYGKLLPQIKAALAAADGADIAAKAERGDDIIIEIAGETLTLTGEDVLIETSSAQGYACGQDGGYLTALDTTLSADLVREGLARELVRTVQEARKQAGLEVSDRIVLGVSGSAGVQAALDEFRDYLMSETLAVEWQTGQADPLWQEQRSLDAERWSIEISRSDGQG